MEKGDEGSTRPGLGERFWRGDLMVADCPSRIVLKHLTSRWGVLVLIALQAGTLRFSDLRRAIGGISERMLAQTLQDLEGDGIVARHAHPVVPPHVDYALTPLGREAAQEIRRLTDWIESSMPRIEAARDIAFPLPTGEREGPAAQRWEGEGTLK